MGRANTNKIMQAPLDDSIMGQHNDFSSSKRSKIHRLVSSSESSDEDELGSQGYITAFSKSRSRSVRRRREESQPALQ